MSTPPQSRLAPETQRHRVLIADQRSGVLAAFGELAPTHGFEAQHADGASEALALLEREGTHDCVVALGEGSVERGLAFLAEVARRWPTTTRILVADEPEHASVVAALSVGCVSRVLRAPLQPDDVAAALDAAALHAAGRRREHELAEELAFTRDSLADLLDELEGRLAHEVDSLRGVHDLAGRLTHADSLEEVARIAVEAFSGALGGRAVRVELPSPLHGPRVRAEAGSGRGRFEPVLDEGALGPTIFVANAADLTRRDRRVLGSLLSATALAAKSQVHRIEREEAQHATVFALARLAERRDNETGQHLVRVSEYSRLIALGLRDCGLYTEELTDRFIDDVARSAPLHDIGKVGIPDQVLLKPGRLTGEEWEIMRRHTTIGGDTLRSVIENTPRPGFLRVAHDIALYHHERWDGAGYPEGLQGEDIPLCARIVTLADVYDALTTRRPYKDPWTSAEATELILRERGLQFDPAVVDAFLCRQEEVERVRLANLDDDAHDGRAA